MYIGTGIASNSLMTHERTKAGRAFLNLHRKVRGLTERNRTISAPADIDVADRVQIELYDAACNGATEYHQQLLESVNELFVRR